jgi:hypothetical protein
MLLSFIAHLSTVVVSTTCSFWVFPYDNQSDYD